MLIRISGGKKGILEYLVTGRKSGRTLSRGQLDKRLILDGDLEFTDQIIKSMRGKGEKYLHITLSFKEDIVEEETLKEINQKFKEFAFSAFNKDEFCYYSEAHLPRMKSTQDLRTGKFNTRKPHIHIVIPKKNLLSWTGLNPFGFVRRYEKYIDAFQEHINDKFDLESPKDNRRLAFCDRSDVTSKYRGDFFSGSSREVKKKVLSAVLDHDMHSRTELYGYLKEWGEVKIRNKGTLQEYYNLKIKDSKKGINLKEYFFQDEFLSLPKSEKVKVVEQRGIDKSIPHAYKKVDRIMESELLLSSWKDYIAKEVKYINSGNRKVWKKYNIQDKTKKKKMLREFETKFYDKHAMSEISEEANLNEQEFHDYSKSTEVILPEKTNNEIFQRLLTSFDTQKFHNIKPSIMPLNERSDLLQQLVNYLIHTAGIDPDDIGICEESEISHHIKYCGKAYNTTHFLTQCMYFDSERIKKVLSEILTQYDEFEISYSNQRLEPQEWLWQLFAEERKRYSEQQKAEMKKLYKRRNIQMLENREEYRKIKRQIISSIQNNAERNRRISLLQMSYVQKQNKLYENTKSSWQQLKRSGYMDYNRWLQKRAQQGDLEALIELRRMNPFEEKQCSKMENVLVSEKNEYIVQVYSEWKYDVDLSGNIVYQVNDQLAICDHGSSLEFYNLDDKILLTGLQLAMVKYGPKLKAFGSKSFKEKVAQVAADYRIPVRFSDEWMNINTRKDRDFSF